MPHILGFKHLKLNKEARVFRHEIQHLTMDLRQINIKIQKAAALGQWFVDSIGSKKKSHLIANFESELSALEEVHYHLENFLFRVHAYRDKICVFLNCSLRLGYDNGDTDLQNRLQKNRIIKEHHLSTELKKFGSPPLSTFLAKRKLISHKVYYGHEDYSPHLLPKANPSVVGIKKASTEWHNKIKSEIGNADKCFLKIVEINSKITEKVIKFLDKE